MKQSHGEGETQRLNYSNTAIVLKRTGSVSALLAETEAVVHFEGQLDGIVGV